MYLKINIKGIVAFILSCWLAIFLVACVSENNTGGSSPQYLTVATKKVVTHGLQAAKLADYSTLRDVVKGNNIYVAVGDNGAIITSKDGNSWQEQDNVVSESLASVTYNPVNKLFYAVGDAGRIVSSSDGVNWTIYDRLNPPVKLNSIMSVKGDEIAVGDSGNVFEIAVTSSKRGLIVNRALDTTESATSTAFNGSDMMIIGTSDGGLYYKTYSTFSTSNWNKSKLFANMPISDISYDVVELAFIATTSNGAVIRSSDGKVWSSPVFVDPSSKSKINLNSIAVEPVTERFLVAGSDEMQNALVRFSTNFNQWSADSLSAKYQIQKVRCFDSTSCVAVGDKKTLVFASKKSDLSGMSWKIIDLVQPTVELKEPLNGATNIATQPMIKLSFNKHVNNINSSTIMLRENNVTGKIIPISNITVSGDDFVFSPLVKLSDSTKYVVVIADGITDDSGYKVPQSIFGFVTGDFTAPTVISLYPDDGIIGTSVTPIIQLNFSELVKNVNTSNVTLHQNSPNGPLVEVDDIIQGNDNIYSFTAAYPLLETTKYYVVVNSNVTDLQDNHLKATQFSFTTGDFTAPSVSMVSPNDNSTGVVTTASVQLKFSESVVNVNKTTVLIRANSISGTPITIDSISEQSGNMYTLTPANGALATNTKYYVTFDSTIKDKSNNSLIQKQFSFTTVTPAAQNITFSPIVGAKIGGSFDLIVNTSWAESVEITLPSGLKTSSGLAKFVCNSNLSCKTTIKVSDTATVGNYLIQAVGLTSAFKFVGTVPVTNVVSYLIAVASAKSAEICQISGSSVNSCTTTDLTSVVSASIYGAAISHTGGLYLLTKLSSGANTGVYKCGISNMKIINCVAQTEIVNNSIPSGVFSVDGKYFYYNNMTNSTVNMCKVAVNGDLTNCTVVKSDLTRYVERLTLNANGDRLLVNTGYGVVSCVVDKSTGLINSCLNNTNAVSSWGIGFNLDNTSAYTTMSGRVSMCSYNYVSNQLTSCIDNNSYGTLSITGIAFTPSMVILSNMRGKLQKCSLDSAGAVVSCADLVGSSIVGTEGITVFN